MLKITILCHPLTPAPAGDLEAWLEAQLDGLREAAPQGIIRLSRLAQDLPDTEIDVGWVVELELPGEAILPGRQRLADALADLVTDMRFLGLQPRVLTPNGLDERASVLSASGSDQPTRVSAIVLDYPGLQ
jgi:hypothetical protein